MCNFQTLSAEESPAQPISLLFETDIRPLFERKCAHCHSETVRKGDLDVSSMTGLHKGGESGESALAESWDEGMLWMMLDSESMPPEGEEALTAEELTKIQNWLKAGAPAKEQVQLTETITQHDVLPILLLRCTACHGAQLQEAKLDLRSIGGLKAGSENGPVMVPGDPKASLMIQRIESEACPPKGKLLKFFVRRTPESELNTLKTWLAEGAQEFPMEPDIATEQPDPLVTDEDRKHWAYHSPQRPTEGNSVDDYILAKLQERGLNFSPEAERDTLIRRAFLDLIGMPPQYEDWQHWRMTTNPNWYAEMIDELLASPHYGEWWGRYWLDLAGYADSEGGVSSDPLREVAWKYRDYVIESFNEDKPYDRFLIEQLAGDELVDYEHAETITQEIVDKLVATGFLRMGIDQTGSRTMNFVPERLGVINDAITIVGSGLMGMTVECARCHSHKYDPIPQRDYYRLKAVFQGALDEHDWLSFKTRKVNLGTPEQRELVNEVNPPILKEVRSLEQQLRTAQRDVILATLREFYPEQPEDDRQATLAALKVADNNRTLKQRQLVELFLIAEIKPYDLQPQSVISAREHVESLEQQILGVKEKLVAPLTVRALWDRGEPSPTYLLRRGEYNKPGPLVGPGVPAVLTDGRTPFVYDSPFGDSTKQTGRRLAFARWLTSPEHPLTARVMVNRIWYHHFGTGLVNTLENFGLQGERPSHPELLDWLALEFIDRGWSIKELHRLIMNSQTYRQSSLVSQERYEADPTNRLLSRMPLRRMNAEALRDSLLQVSEKLDTTPGGPPDPISVDRDGLVSVIPEENGKYRRSVYLQYRRTQIPSLMETFDYPIMGPNCTTRTVSTVAPQSLMLMNNAHVRELAASLAKSVANETSVPEEQISLFYKLVLTREPTDQEEKLGLVALKTLKEQWPDRPEAALESYSHILLNSAAFIYID